MMMTLEEEAAYVQGSRTAWRSILGEALMHLGIDDPEAAKARWIIERIDAIEALREMCKKRGDNDWSDNLYLADIINKHVNID
jgi:hypothetical protein